MPKISLALFLLALPWVATAALDAAENSITLDDYQHGLSSGWQEKKFKGQTQYSVARKDGVDCIAAVSEASASGLFYTITFAPESMPILRWQWQIADIVANGDATKKGGDDYAARVYVVFPGTFFWQTRALNYIWDNRLPKGTILKNAYTKNAMMVVVESGPENRGRWLTEERDLRADFLAAFGEPPPAVGAIAIMTDTDDTGSSARAWYGPIRVMKAAD